MRAEREDWLKKMLKIDKTNTTAFPGGNCVQYDQQTLINFRGFNSKDISNFIEVYPYDISNNGRFNLPLLEVIIVDYDSNGKLISHAMNTIVLGNNALNWNDLCNVEPQFDQINVQPGEAYLYGLNSIFVIRGPPTIMGDKIVGMNDYWEYSIKNNVPTFIKTNPDIKLIMQRGK